MKRGCQISSQSQRQGVIALLTKEQILTAVKAGRASNCIDGRDYGRLVDFFPVDQWKELGFEFTGTVPPEPSPWTEDAIVARMRHDVSFGFEKALNKRGISSAMMYNVVKMWLWILEDDLQSFSDESYAQYGLPLFKAVALKFRFEDPLGGDSGTEMEYSSD